ncbi:hypothetical protein E2C01_002418 [Portunus trituberculatus]|uniref:Uncharacterized protein n=1 Tax=Portunus trituberculatus TaxID=210409 RepID=A0A5B7CKB9_PORTR|nr:hypothetical protein [Portunus trituberculatus]
MNLKLEESATSLPIWRHSRASDRDHYNICVCVFRCLFRVPDGLGRPTLGRCRGRRGGDQTPTDFPFWVCNGVVARVARRIRRWVWWVWWGGSGACGIRAGRGVVSRSYGTGKGVCQA